MTQSFKDFVAQNGIVATTAGITIGFATATFVKSLVADVVMPVIFMILVKSTGKASFFSKFLSDKEFLFTNFVSEFITWILIVLTAWIVLAVAFKYLSSATSISLPTMSNPFMGHPATVGPSPVTVSQEQKPKAPWEMYSERGGYGHLVPK